MWPDKQSKYEHLLSVAGNYNDLCHTFNDTDAGGRSSRMSISNLTCGCSGFKQTMLACLTVLYQILPRNSCAYHDNYIHSFGRALHTLTAVLRSPQPSAVCGMVKMNINFCAG